MRLDKLLEELQFGSRKTVKRLIKGKQVTVDGIVTLNESQNVDAQLQMIKVKVLEVNAEQKKISLSKRQAEENTEAVTEEAAAE